MLVSGKEKNKTVGTHNRTGVLENEEWSEWYVKSSCFSFLGVL